MARRRKTKIRNADEIITGVRTAKDSRRTDKAVRTSQIRGGKVEIGRIYERIRTP